MKELIVGIVIVAVGFVIIAFRKKFVRNSIVFQNKTFGFSFGQREG